MNDKKLASTADLTEIAPRYAFDPDEAHALDVTLDVAKGGVTTLEIQKAAIDLTRLQLAREREEQATEILRQHISGGGCDCEACLKGVISQLGSIFLAMAFVFVAGCKQDLLERCAGPYVEIPEIEIDLEGYERTLQEIADFPMDKECLAITEAEWRALGSAINVTSTTDAIVNDGNCTLREAFRAAMRNEITDACPAGVARPAQDQILIPPGTYILAIPIVPGTNENASLTGDLDVTETVAILGTSSTSPPIIDANRLDSALHLTGNVGNLSLWDVVLTRGCPNGGNCRQQIAGRAPAGGGFYDNSNANLDVQRVLLLDGEAQIGGGFSICKPVVSSSTLTEVNCEGNTAWAGGGACAANHASFGWHDSCVRSSHLQGGGRAAVRQYGNNSVASRAALFNVTVEDNDEGVQADRGGVTNANTRLTMVGGALRRNRSVASGGNARASGATVVLDGVDVDDGTADLAGWPTGSGGNLACDVDGAYGCRMEIRGATAVSGGVDLSTSPTWAPDCVGQVDAYGAATVANVAGCTLVQH